MTEHEASRLLAMLRAAYPRQAIDDDNLRVYVHRMRDLEFEAGKRAVVAWIDTSKWFPTIAELRELMVGDDIDDRLPTFDEVIAELRSWVSANRWGERGPHLLTRAACEAIGGFDAWRQAPDPARDPSGYRHTVRVMRGAYETARATLRQRALSLTKADLDRFLPPRSAPVFSLPPPGWDPEAGEKRRQERLHEVIRHQDEIQRAQEDAKSAPRTGPVGFGNAKALAKRERNRT